LSQIWILNPIGEYVIEFHQGEWFHIKGRGHVFATKMPQDHDKSLLGTDVKIGEFVYRVVGVEMQGLNDPSLTKGRAVGILVRGERKDV
jgi:hypothetical protein